MNCGIYAISCYLKDLGFYDENLIKGLKGCVDKDGMLSILDIVDVCSMFGLSCKVFYNAWYSKRIGILYLKKQKHFMYVQSVKWNVILYDVRVQRVQILWLVYCIFAQGIMLVIEKNDIL